MSSPLRAGSCVIGWHGDPAACCGVIGRTPLPAVLGERAGVRYRAAEPRRVKVPLPLSVPAQEEVPHPRALYGGVTWCLASAGVPIRMKGTPARICRALVEGRGPADLRRHRGAQNLKLDVTSTKRTMDASHHDDSPLGPGSRSEVDRGEETGGEKVPRVLSVLPGHGRRHTSGCFTLAAVLLGGCM